MKNADKLNFVGKFKIYDPYGNIANYVKGDVVSLDNKQFVATRTISGISPYVKSSGWEELSPTTGTSSISNYVVSINGTTGAIASVAKTNAGQTFSGNQTFNDTVYITGNLIVLGKIETATGIFGATANAVIEPVDNMNLDGGEF
jgi:hypothetical protein